MALHWNIIKCKDESIKSEKEWGVTENLIFMTMAVGLREISEENWKEFLFRLKVIEIVDGPILRKVDSKPAYYTPEIIKKRIGLWSNVSNETRSSWLKRYLNRIYVSIEREIEIECQELGKDTVMAEAKNE